MPNHVYNIIQARPEVLDALCDAGSDGAVDFALVVPVPANYQTGGCSHSHPLEWDDADPDRNCWYSWNRRFWGTKWNGYESDRPIEEELVFKTAWSHPAPVVEALSLRFPDDEITVQFADEDMGANCARYTIRDGEITDLFQPADGSEDALELAYETWYGDGADEARAEAMDAWAE